MENLSRVFQKQKRKTNMKRLSFITQFKLEFLLPFTSCRKVLGKMPEIITINFLLANGDLLKISVFIFFDKTFIEAPLHKFSFSKGRFIKDISPYQSRFFLLKKKKVK